MEERKTINLLSLFSGIGAFEKALENLHIPFHLVGYSEIDKHASKAYSLIHGVSDDLNYGDITKIDEKSIPPLIDLITYGFPCQDISILGKERGLFGDSGNKTRSGLFYDALRIIKHIKPKIAIAENVKNLTSKRFRADFDEILQSLDEAGYSNYWQVLNAKDYNIPQNRERVLIVSVRKDVDTGIFKFPEPLPLELKLKDLLEDDVEEKYYLNDKKIKMFSDMTNRNGFIRGKRFNPFELDDDRVAHTITTRPTSRPEGNFIKSNSGLKIRGLTPKECFRLMGFDDKDVDILVKHGVSDAQLFKMAGNSIVVTMLGYLFKNLMPILKKEKKNEENN